MPSTIRTAAKTPEAAELGGMLAATAVAALGAVRCSAAPPLPEEAAGSAASTAAAELRSELLNPRTSGVRYLHDDVGLALLLPHPPS